MANWFLSLMGNMGWIIGLVLVCMLALYVGYRIRSNMWTEPKKEEQECRRMLY